MEATHLVDPSVSTSAAGVRRTTLTNLPDVRSQVCHVLFTPVVGMLEMSHRRVFAHVALHAPNVSALMFCLSAYSQAKPAILDPSS
jgi:hypothetical protein